MSDWKLRAQKAIATRDAGIPAEWTIDKASLPNNVTTVLESSGILGGNELAILEYSATELAKRIAAGDYTAEAVTLAYCKAAAIAQQATNCVVELFVDEALERARWLDAEFAKGHIVGPLHGVPVSIKDHFDIAGHDSPAGFLCRVGQSVAKEDSHLAKILRNAGAVFYVKSTNPQLLMHLECDSYLGPTVNPYNRKLTCGGSSGGEGALMGMKASPLGVGGDIGGSVRSPAANCGVFSFKPSTHRLPSKGIQAPMAVAGWSGIEGTQGPFGRSVQDLQLYMSISSAARPWLEEQSVRAKPWLDVNLPEKIRVGVWRTDGIVTPTPPIARALGAVVDKLAASDRFEVVELDAACQKTAWKLISALYWPDGGAAGKSQIQLSGEPSLPLSDWILGHAMQDMTLAQALELVLQRDAMRDEFARYWRTSGIDVLLCPTAPTPAPLLGTAKYWNYTSFWNLVDYPAAVFPTGLYCDPAVDSTAGMVPKEGEEEAVWETFDARESEGAPLGLQLVSYIGHEEECLAALAEIVKVYQA